MKTRSTLPFNLDRKLVGTVVTGAVVYLLTQLLHLDVSEELKASIATLVAFVVGYLLPPSATSTA